MSFISVKEASEKWGITERVVRQYCADGRVPGAFITGKTWNIPENAEKPGRKPRQRQVPKNLLGRLVLEKENAITGGNVDYKQMDRNNILILPELLKIRDAKE